MSLPVVAQRFIDAITIGDADAARSCYAPDADIWHNFDDITQTVDDNIAEFLRTRRSMEIWIESAPDAFPTFAERIGASGDIDAAIAEFGIRHNAS